MTPVGGLRFRSVLQEWRASLVHAHLPAMGALARIMSLIPVVYTEHNVAWSYRTPVRLVNRATYHRNTAVIAVSDAVAASIADYRGPHV